MTRKLKSKITYEILRKDAAQASDLLTTAIVDAFACYDITERERDALISFAKMLKGATHIVVHDADTLPD